ncbi:MAG: FAD-dependent oxidoreductase [Myxococcota bacterium]
MSAADVAVIGAGMAGLSCARRLARAGRRVVVFDKAATPGGRVATRGWMDVRWDHGCARLSAEAMAATCVAGVATAPWDGGRVVVPSMHRLPLTMARGLRLVTRTRIVALQRGDRRSSQGNWRLEDAEGRVWGPYEDIALSVPAPQGMDLLRGVEGGEALRRLGVRARFEARLSLLVALATPRVGPALVRPEGDPIASVVDEGAKPGRGPRGFVWTVQSTSEFARRAWTAPFADKWARLHRALETILGEGLDVRYATVKGWRFGLVATPGGDDGQPCWYAGDEGLGACGDWFLGDSVTHALRSGRALAEEILR